MVFFILSKTTGRFIYDIPYQLYFSSNFSANFANFSYVPLRPIIGYVFLSLNVSSSPLVVRIGIFQIFEYLATGAKTYGHTGPRKTSVGKNKSFPFYLFCV